MVTVRHGFRNRANRSHVQTHDYDIVYGPIANDAVAVSIALYTDEFISKEELLRRLKYRHETYQYFSWEENPGLPE